LEARPGKDQQTVLAATNAKGLEKVVKLTRASFCLVSVLGIAGLAGAGARPQADTMQGRVGGTAKPGVISLVGFEPLRQKFQRDAARYG